MNPRRRGLRRLIASITVFVACIVGLAAYVRLMPAYSDEEIHGLQTRADQMRAETAAETCERSTYGDARPAMQRDFESLYLDSVTRACLERFNDESIELLYGPRTATHDWSWALDRGDKEDAPQSPHVMNMRISGPVPPDDAAAPAVVPECGHVMALVDRLAATPNLCSPLGPTKSAGMEDIRWALGLGVAVAVLARWRARGGNRLRSFEEGLRGIVVVRDLRRGPTSWMAAMVSVAAEASIVAQMASLLIDDPGFSGSEYDELHRTIVRILEDRTGAGAIVRADRFAALDAVTNQDELGLALDFVVNDDPSWCADDSGPQECIDAIRAMPTTEPPDELTIEWLGKRLTRARTLEASLSGGRTAFANYLGRLALADVNLQQLGVLLRLARARARSEACPPMIDATHLETDASDQPFEVVAYSGDMWELAGPPLRALPNFERSAFTFACPAARAAYLPIEPESDVGSAHHAPQ